MTLNELIKHLNTSGASADVKIIAVDAYNAGYQEGIKDASNSAIAAIHFGGKK